MRRRKVFTLALSMAVMLLMLIIPITTKAEQTNSVNTLSTGTVNNGSVDSKKDDIHSINVQSNKEQTSTVQTNTAKSENVKSDSEKANSIPKNGWYVKDGAYYWYENGVKQGTDGRGKEIFDPESNAWYWLDAVQDGAKAVSKDVFQESDGGKWVRYDENGQMIKEWQTTKDGVFYFDKKTGAMTKGLATIDGKEYYFDEESGIKLRHGWVTDGNQEFWYEKDVRQGTTGRGKEIFDPETNAWYWLDAVQDGAKTVSKDVYQESSGGKWVRYDKDGHMIKGWDKSKDGTYYFDLKSGAMFKDWNMINDKDYYFDIDTGVMTSNGWAYKDDNAYWYEDGVRQGTTGRGKEIYDSNLKGWFWLDAVQNGARAVNKDVFQESNGGKWVRYNCDGFMIKEWDTNDNGTYYFDPVTGAMTKEWRCIDDNNYYFNPDTGVHETDISKIPFNKNNLSITKESNGAWAIKKNDAGEFRVLQLTDIHLRDDAEYADRTELAKKAVAKLIENARPDLIVMTGDFVYSMSYDDSADLDTYDMVVDFINRINVPWIWTFGNHDHMFFDHYSDEEISKMLSRCKSLIQYDIDPTVDGYTNGEYRLYDSDNQLNKVIFTLDTHDVLDQTTGVYDYVHDNQVEWYKERVKLAQKKFGANVESYVFMHIPSMEYKDAWDAYMAGDENATHISGYLRENVCCSSERGELGNTMNDLGSTTMIFCGHDHINDFAINYHGITYVYSKSIDYSAYCGIGIQYLTEQRGATLLCLTAGRGNSKMHSIQLSEIPHQD